MFIGVDVGTGSARACLMDENGEIVSLASREIKRFEPKQDYWNQSTSNIWESICYSTKQCLEESGIDPAKVKGIAFDATCSLVATDENLESLSVGPDFAIKDQDVLLWMDHRAVDETKKVNATKASLLEYVGGQMSIEMEVPKMLWLKNNLPAEQFAEYNFYDLADYLTDRASGVNARSYNSVVCKQGFVPLGVDGSKEGWSKKFLEEIGLGELCEDDFSRLGGIPNKNGVFHCPGEKVGYLTQQSAEELGLTTKCIVASGMIDAYSGWVGTVAAKTDLGSKRAGKVNNRLAAVAGTSTCHIVISDEAVFVPGVWGPYRDALLPGKWAAEGGQSTTGELLHHILVSHPAYNTLVERSVLESKSVFEVLNALLDHMRVENGLESVLPLAKHLFLYGDLYGNRSPLADPTMRGAIVGISMDVSIENLALVYLATVEFICLQTRQIIEVMNSKGHDINSIYLSGGQCRNEILTHIMATATGMPVVIPKYIDAAVVFGTAILAATASEGHESLWQAMSKFSGSGSVVEPGTDKIELALLNAKYDIMYDMLRSQQKYRDEVNKSLEEAQ